MTGSRYALGPYTPLDPSSRRRKPRGPTRASQAYEISGFLSDFLISALVISDFRCSLQKYTDVRGGLRKYTDMCGG